MKSFKKKRTHAKLFTGLFITVLLIILIQFGDSFCMGLYDKMQSYILTDFLISRHGFSENSAAGYLSLFMLPCYAITATAPAVRALSDKYGKSRILFINIVLLLTGCSLSIFSSSLVLFLIGNALITFSCTMDLQNLYIAEDIPYQYRGTMSGLTQAISSCAAMTIPLLRTILIERYQYGWRSIYMVAFIGTILLLISASILLKIRNYNPPRKENAATAPSQSPRFKDIFQFLRNQTTIRSYLILLLILGIATPGITFYNEPVLSFTLTDSASINRILLIQPLTTLVFTFFNGILADKFQRIRVITADIMIAILFILCFTITLHTSASPAVLGIAWGIMVGAYFAAIELISLTIIEQIPHHNIGKFSALSTYAYGFGDAVGMLIISLLTLKVQMDVSKLLLALPIFIIALTFIFMIHHPSSRFPSR